MRGGGTPRAKSVWWGVQERTEGEHGWDSDDLKPLMVRVSLVCDAPSSVAGTCFAGTPSQGTLQTPRKNQVGPALHSDTQG